MSDAIPKYPLAWPTGQPRTNYRQSADFKVDFGRSRDELLNALKLLGTRHVILSTNVAIRQDGLPYANMPEPRDPGVAVYFDRNLRVAGTWAWRPFVIACDHYSKVKWNVRAVWATVEALRSIQRHGASSMLEQAFTGFAALPPARATKPWREVLGVGPNALEDDIRHAYRQLAGIHHPDRVGGNTARMAEINSAYEEGMKEVTGA